MRIFFGMLLLLWSVADSLAQGSADAGKQFWEGTASRCKDCHGLGGEGGFGPDLAGRRLSLEQFARAIRVPWGIMPAFTPEQLSDQNVANLFAHFQSLSPVKQPGPWSVTLPPDPKPAQRLLIATVGCAQCHLAALSGPRAHMGAIDADYEWFRNMVYRHTAVIRQHRALVGEELVGIRMGNYSPARLPESLLAEIWRYVRDDLKFRVLMSAELGPEAPAGAGVSQTLTVANEGLVGRGLTAEDLTVELTLVQGATVVSATGAGYQGVRRDSKSDADVAVWHLARLGPKDRESYTITFASGPGSKVARGIVRWTKPAQGDGSGDQANVATSR